MAFENRFSEQNSPAFSLSYLHPADFKTKTKEEIDRLILCAATFYTHQSKTGGILGLFKVCNASKEAFPTISIYYKVA